MSFLHLQDICSQRANAYGNAHVQVAEAHLAAALVLAEVGETTEKAREQLSHAKKILESTTGSVEKQQQLWRYIEAHLSTLKS